MVCQELSSTTDPNTPNILQIHSLLYSYIVISLSILTFDNILKNHFKVMFYIDTDKTNAGVFNKYYVK